MPKNKLTNEKRNPTAVHLWTMYIWTNELCVNSCCCCFLFFSSSIFRSCMQWWNILPPTYKFFLIVIILLVLLVFYMYVQKLVNHMKNAIDDDGRNVQKFIPNPELPLPASASILHQFKRGVVCSDSRECSKIGRYVHFKLQFDTHV